jgi:hypothetical protein
MLDLQQCNINYTLKSFIARGKEKTADRKILFQIQTQNRKMTSLFLSISPLPSPSLSLIVPLKKMLS